MTNDKLSWKQRRFLTLLGLPAFGISLAYTVMTTYLPILTERLSGATVTGLLIGTEGVFAIFVPILVGQWSDSIQTRFGGRMPFILAATGLAVTALVLTPSLSSSLAGIACALAVFFVAYFAYYSPYYALFPDLVSEEVRGRSQGAQGGFRSAGMLLALVGGGLLLALWEPLPFFIGAVAVAGVTAALFFGVRDQLGREEDGSGDGRMDWKAEWELVRGNLDIRLWIIANGLWESAIGVLRVFVVLYFTRGLGFSLSGASGALALVGVAAVVAAPLSGMLADRYGHRPVMLAALWFFGLGALLPLFTINTYFLIGILPGAFAAVILMTLPYSVLMGLLPEERHGAGAALFGLSQGAGVVVGPLLAGIAVDLLKPVGLLAFGETQGYAAIFGVASVLLLVSTPLLLRMKV